MDHFCFECVDCKKQYPENGTGLIKTQLNFNCIYTCPCGGSVVLVEKKHTPVYRQDVDDFYIQG